MARVFLLTVLIFVPAVFAQAQSPFAVQPPTYEDYSKERDQERDRKAFKPPTKTERSVYWASVGYNAAGTAFDFVTTVGVIDRGGGELNPILAVFGRRNKAGVVGLGAGIQTTISLVNHFFVYKRGHPKLAATLNFVQGSLHFGVGLHNRGVCREGCKAR